MVTFIIFHVSERTRLGISREPFVRKTIHMLCQALFALNKKLSRMSSAAVVIGTFKVYIPNNSCFPVQRIIKSYT